jgi:hypothetical protein
MSAGCFIIAGRATPRASHNGQHLVGILDQAIGNEQSCAKMYLQQMMADGTWFELKNGISGYSSVLVRQQQPLHRLL